MFTLLWMHVKLVLNCEKLSFSSTTKAKANFLRNTVIINMLRAAKADSFWKQDILAVHVFSAFHRVLAPVIRQTFKFTPAIFFFSRQWQSSYKVASITINNFLSPLDDEDTTNLHIIITYKRTRTFMLQEINRGWRFKTDFIVTPTQHFHQMLGS